MLKALLAILFCLSVGSAVAADRVALVIGNGAYASVTPLDNPANDAEAVAAVLEGIGFEVIKGIDLDRAGMERSLRAFIAAIRDAELVLFYYAGHGLQVNGRNYLVPIDASIEDEASLDFETIEADKVFGYMGGNDRIALAFLDACRDNPLSRRLARSMGATRSGDVGSGLAAPRTAGTGLFIGFATAPGDVAADGSGANSPFTEAILRHIATPGLEINQVMTRVKADVQVATAGDQRPWTNSDLSSEVVLVPGLGGVDAEVWLRIADSGIRSDYESFIRFFPDSPFRGDAEARLALLASPEAGVPAEQPAGGPPSDATLRRLTIGTVTGTPWVREGRGGLTGFEVDLVGELCRRGGFTCAFEATDGRGLSSGLVDGRFDAGLGSIGYRDLAPGQTLSYPYATLGEAEVHAFGRSDASVSLTDLGLRIGLAEQPDVEATIRAEFGSRATLAVFSDLRTARTALLSGGIDLLLTTQPSIGFVASMRRVEVPIVLGKPVGLLFAADGPLRDAFNSAILASIDDGTRDAILAGRWRDGDEPAGAEEPQSAERPERPAPRFVVPDRCAWLHTPEAQAACRARL